MWGTRRDVLRRGLALGAGATLAPALLRPPMAVAADPWRLPPGFALPLAPGLGLPFAHGVASGDPLADRVVLWTRVTVPEPDRREPIDVAWRVARDPQMRDVVARGRVETGAQRDWTVKVDAVGLRPRTTYFYDFAALGRRSITGRTRTAPGGAVPDVRIAVLACSSYWSGHFNAYARLAERDDLDLVVHTGDHVYDNPDPDEWVRARDGRFDRDAVDFRDWRTLDEVRRRYALYYADPDFVALHRAHPVSVIWDNHDLGGDAGTAAAQQAFWEWTPSRPPLPDGSGEFGPAATGQVTPADPRLLYRRLPYGPLADVLLIDTRHIGREPRTASNFATRRLLGDRQLDWLTGAMVDGRDRGVAWSFLVNQVLMGQLLFVNLPRAVRVGGDAALPFAAEVREGVTFNPSQWDGYPRERDLLFGRLREAGLRDVLVATGDMHGSFAYDLVEDPALPAYEPLTGRGTLGSVGVEFAPSSVTRGGADESVMGALYRAAHDGRAPEADRAGFEALRATGVAATQVLETALRAVTPNLRYFEWTQHGFGIAHLTPEAATLEFWWTPIQTRSGAQRLGAQLRVRRGSAHAERVLRPVPTRSGVRPPSAPLRDLLARRV